ncbi:hypothetical protein ACERK3_06430 [Phycisphaerales bacterium AB-hyl4]|uniref:Alpha-galactosidase n=1 Tax=Natronomicrosphaera hydrolytica TaxID=3242702 RepID=A0ABV4U2W9_9BACT
MGDLHSSCYADLSGGLLVIGNTLFERRWALAGRSLTVRSVLDKRRGVEWAQPGADLPVWRHPQLVLPAGDDATGGAGLETAVDDLAGAAEPHLRADLVLTRGGAKQVFRFRVWDALPVVLYSVFCEGADGAWGTIDEPELVDVAGRHYRPTADRLDSFDLAQPQASWQVTALLGRTDWRDTLVESCEGVLFPKQTARRAGHLLHVRAWHGEAGLAAIKLAPPFEEQINTDDCDFALSASNLSICGSGVSRHELAAGEPTETYRVAVGVTDGQPTSGAALFRALMRRLSPPRVPAEGAVFANNWGGGGGTQVLSQAFVEAELKAAGRLGVTQYQIDAGWHHGDARQLHVEQLEPASTSTVSDRFWDVDTSRFPDGLSEVAKYAAARGVRLGLWYCLDRANDYEHWRRDLATMLDLWRNCQVTQFKIDGLSLGSRLAERRVAALFAELFRESQGQVAITLDVTGGRARRLGTCCASEHIADYFLENRYLRNGSYHPHRTLRNVWQLARFIPTYRLQVEWLDTARYEETYGDHPLAPARFGTAYSLATTLFARPLAWMHLQHLPTDTAASVQRLLRAYLPHQHDILAGEVDPIGEEPSGAAWTGFCSRRNDSEGYLLVFREVNDRPSCRIALPGMAGGVGVTLHRIVGDGRQRKLSLDSEGRGLFKLAQPRSFALYRYVLA